MIFYLSSQPPNISHGQSRMAIKIIRAIDGFFDISDTAICGKITDFLKDKWFFGIYKSTNMLVRKSAHFGIYFLLGAITVGFGYAYTKKMSMGLLLGISLPVVIAALDEYNQGFVGRTSSLDDVLIDGIGALTGSLVGILIILIIKVYSLIRKGDVPKRKHRRK